jgi:hypothetical protein
MSPNAPAGTVRAVRPTPVASSWRFDHGRRRSRYGAAICAARVFARTIGRTPRLSSATGATPGSGVLEQFRDVAPTCPRLMELQAARRRRHAGPRRIPRVNASRNPPTEAIAVARPRMPAMNGDLVGAVSQITRSHRASGRLRAPALHLGRGTSNPVEKERRHGWFGQRRRAVTGCRA